METPEAIDAVLRGLDLEDFCRQRDIAYLGIFGSYARGDYDENSDIDLLVRFSKPKSLLDLVRVERELAEQIGKPVDLLTEGSLSPYIRERVLAETKRLYEAA